MEGRDTVVFDIDNTLVDSRERFKRSLHEASGGRAETIDQLNKEEMRRFWEVFLSPKYIELDKPMYEAIEEVLERARRGYYIVILTGRPEKLRSHTEKQLDRFGIPYDRLIMRANGDYRKDYEYKSSMLKRLLEEGLNIVEYHEDLSRTIQTVRERFPWIKVCHHRPR